MVSTQRFTVFCFALALGAGAVFAGGRTLWQEGGVQLCGPSIEKGELVATSDGASGAIVAWLDRRDYYTIDIYAQRVDANGVPQWTENGVLTRDSTGWGTLNITDDGKQGAIVVSSTTWYGAGLSVQRVRADGTPLWGANGIMLRDYRDSIWDMPALVRDGHGGVVVVWNAYHMYGLADTLLACRVDSSGNEQWETVVLVDTINGAPTICPDGFGGAVMAWTEHFSGPVRVQRVDSAGIIRWDSAGVRVCTLSTTHAARACVAVGDSRFVVGLCARVGGGTFHNRVQMLDLAGKRRWALAGVPLDVNGSTGAVGLGTGYAGQSVWVWFENRTGTNDLFAQKLDSSGARCWDTTGVWVGTSNSSGAAGFSATVDGRDGAIAAWSMYRGPLNSDIYAQHTDSAGRLCWSDTGLAVCPGDNNVTSPVAVTDGDGGVIVAWKDDRGIYAQRAVDVIGVEESHEPQASSYKPAASVVRGILRLVDGASASRGLSAHACLLDVSGRKVMELRAGANDVRALAPGVYFMRMAQAQVQAQAVEKIVITK